MTAEITTIIVSLVAVVIAMFAIYRSHAAGTPITGSLLTTTLQESQATATEIATIVKAGVFAAEQLKSTGKLDGNNAAFQYALKFAQKMLPDLDAPTLTTFIESMVPLANQVYNAATTLTTSSDNVTVTTSDANPPAPPQPMLGRMG